MTFFKLNRNNFEYFTIKTHPAKTFVSGVNLGQTGTINLLAQVSAREKDLRPGGDVRGDRAVFEVEWHPGPAAQASPPVVRTRTRRNKTFGIVREIPPVTFGSGTIKKNNITNVLMDYYRPTFPSMDFSYTNYHSLNFFTGSSVSSASCLIYPTTASNASGTFSVDTAFTFEFWINPRYNFTTDGTILHLSSNYAISLMTGSKRNHDGTASHYRIKLQLSKSSELNPNVATASSEDKRVDPLRHQNPYTFLSDDNTLERNKWHHVAIAWDQYKNDGTGSFYIDTKQKGKFIVSSSIKQIAETDPGVLIIGNYYSGSATNALKNLFNTSAAEREGLKDLVGASGEPTLNPYTFGFPLNAEMHEIRVWNTKRTEEEIKTFSNKSLDKATLIANTSSLRFYLPVLFTKESKARNVKISPYLNITGSTEDGFNVELAARVGALEINLENYVRDWATNQWPKLHNLISGNVGANETIPVGQHSDVLLGTKEYYKRNLTILPNDNGLFNPNFSLLKMDRLYTGSSDTRFIKFHNDLNAEDLSAISLRNTTGWSLAPAYISSSHDNYGLLVGARPTNISASTRTEHIPAILQTTRQQNSDMVSWLNISNIFYGREIKPKSLIIKDTNITGSTSQFAITLRDDGYGNLYRADALTEHAMWNSVGNVFYPEGIVFIKSPHLREFGKQKINVQFSGTQDVHVLRAYIKAPSGMVNSSSNPDYVSRDRSDFIHAHRTDNIIISGINLYNKDMNVVGKVTLAQPIEKASSDEYVFKISIDF